MSPETPLSKRIKRNIIGRRHKFFAATSPGFEAVCLDELMQLQPAASEISVTAGGVEFEGRLDDCYHANLSLRSANRVLMRIDAFKSSNFRQLQKKSRDIPWELYLPPGNLPKIHVTTKHCRLHHSDAISERFQQAIAMRFHGIEARPAFQQISTDPPTIFLRGIDDRFTVSIDSSGDILYKRGLKKHAVRAPLRETLAAAALLLANYNGREPLVDPMCGSGTFSLEAALMAKKIPAGWFRDFAFAQWPSFRPKRWGYIRRQAETQFVQSERPLIFASDIDPSSCQAVQTCVQQHGLSDAVLVHQKDFFDLEPREMTDRIGFISINPPFGRRLGGRNKSEKLFLAICDQLKRSYRGWKMILLAPNRKLADRVPFRTNKYPILHGGLRLVLLVGKIP